MPRFLIERNFAERLELTKEAADAVKLKLPRFDGRVGA